MEKSLEEFIKFNKTDSKIIENLNRSITHKETEPTTAKTT